MRTKIVMTEQVAGFERVLDALALELMESTDEELLQAAKDLGMDPRMRGSAAFIGLRYPAIPRMSDFFEVPENRVQASGPEASTLKLQRPSRGLPSRSSGRRRRHRGGDSDPDRS